MTIKNITIKNLLSFDNIQLKKLEEINCIVGKNNVGKSNFLTLIRFFYDKMEGKRELAPELNSNYSPYGEISIEYDMARMKKMVMSGRRKSKFFNIIYGEFIKDDNVLFDDIFSRDFKDESSSYTLTLKINANGSSEWIEKKDKKISIISYLYPFFYIDSRHIDLYDWNKLWDLLAKIKSFNIDKINTSELHEFFNKSLSADSKIYSDYINLIESSVTIEKYTHKEKVLSILKAGIKGDVFSSNGEKTTYQSDGTNSYHYINSTLKLLMLITRKEYITPFIFIDEPEVGLHPKKCESLINNLYSTHMEYRNNKYITPFPQVIFSTHSPNIVKEVIRNFQENHQVIKFTKKQSSNTSLQVMNSRYTGNNFLSIFSDNEARLFFSDFILFVEGETELELFGNFNLQNKFPILKSIDIYKCANNKLAEGINPSFSNTSIPYLFLYDADKFYEFNRVDNDKLKIKMKDATKFVGIKHDRIKKEINNYKRGFSKKHQAMHEQLKKIDSFVGKEFETSDTGFFFKDNSPLYVFRDITRDFLKEKNVLLLNDTIEGALICIESKNIFYKWLAHEHKIDVENLRNSVLGTGPKLVTIDDKLLLTCIKILFDGKAETQLKKHKKIQSTIYLVKGARYWPTINKTCGWVTSFLDFAIKEIESESCENYNFNTLFSRYFPELHAIILRLYLDRQ